MQAKLLSMLLQVLLSLFTPDLIRTFADTVLDFVEEYVEGTKSTVDDKLVLPLCGMIRSAFGIEE